MSRSVLFLTILCALFTSTAFSQDEKKASPGQAGSGLSIVEVDGKVRVNIDGKLFTEYHYKDVSRPYLYPIIGAHELGMTRNWPMKEVPNEERDHPHHRSWWYAHGAVNGVDFWSESKNAGTTVHDGFIEIKSAKETGHIKSRNKLVAKDGKVIATDERTIRFYNTPGQTRFFDFEITTKASEGEVILGDTKEGTMAVRLAESMRLTQKAGPGKGQIINSEGIKDGETWGKRAKWVDYHGPVNDQHVGLAIFDHPSNPRHPTWWHVRDYGLFAANPFGLSDFEKKPKQAGDLKIAKGGSITFKYRFYFHPGDATQGKVAEAWDKYAHDSAK